MKRARTLAALLTLGVAACTGGAVGKYELYTPPPPLAMVVLVDPSGQVQTQLQQLEGLIRANATPNEALVVMMLATGSTTYTVNRDDSLSTIAAQHGLTLAELEAANPQYGPLAGRNWSLIHAGERVTIVDPAAPNPLLLVSRAPDGPAPPMLMKIPQRPNNPTDYQKAEYEHALTTATAANDSRIAAWKSAAAATVLPWQTRMVALLENNASPGGYNFAAPGGPALAASMAAGLATLAGLPGRRVLLVLGGGDAVPNLAAGSMSGVDLVVANLTDAQSVAAWTNAGKAASATSVNALDSALTQLQLAGIVNK